MFRSRRLAAFLLAATVSISACTDEAVSTTVGALPSATLTILSGAVEVRAVGSDAFSAAIDGQVLVAGDTVATGPGGRSAIRYPDGSLSRIDENTTFTIALLDGSGADGYVIEGEQHSGNTYHRVAEITDSASRFDVVTPTASASVQGTVYAVFVASDGSTTVAVIEGVVIVEGTVGGVVIVSAGFMATVNPDGSIGEVVPIPDDTIDGDWIRFNQCELDGERDCVVPTTSTTAGDSTSTTTAGPTTTSATTTTTQPPASATGLVLTGSNAQLDPVCTRMYRATFVDAGGTPVNLDGTTVTFTVVGGGGSVVFIGGPTASTADGVAVKSVSGGDLGVVRLQATGGGLTSNAIEFNVVPPGGCG